MKRLISLFTAFVMVLSCIPAIAVEIDLFSNSPTISVKDVQVSANATVAEVEVWIENNPGISSAMVNIGYDDEMKLTGIEFNSAFGTYVTAPEPYTNPQSMSVISPSTDLSVSGLFATLTFDISNVSESKESLKFLQAQQKVKWWYNLPKRLMT